MHPFLRADFDDNSSTVDMINQLSNDTLQGIKLEQIEETSGTTKYADSGVPDSHVNLELLVQEIENELQINSGSILSNTDLISDTDRASEVRIPNLGTPKTTEHPFMSSDASFTSSVKQTEFLNLTSRNPYELQHSYGSQKLDISSYQISHQMNAVPSLTQRYPSSVPSPSLYSDSVASSTVPESLKIRQPTIVTGSETVQLEQGMYKLLEKYGIQ